MLRKEYFVNIRSNPSNDSRLQLGLYSSLSSLKMKTKLKGKTEKKKKLKLSFD